MLQLKNYAYSAIRSRNRIDGTCRVGRQVSLTDSRNTGALRGDPYLWLELHETLRLVPKPVIASQFRSQVAICLRHLVGQDLFASQEKMLRVDRYPTHGISGGAVCPPKWVDDLVPLLEDRFASRLPSKGIGNDGSSP